MEVLQALVPQIYRQNQESLRGSNLALLSPRVLWSLVYHHQQPQQSEQEGNHTTTVGDVIPLALQQTCSRPGLVLFAPASAAAVAQGAGELAAAAGGQNDDSSSANDSNWEAAAAAIAAVERAMEDGVVVDGVNGETREDGATTTTTTTTWTLETPTEEDLDELTECIRSYSPGEDDDA